MAPLRFSGRSIAVQEDLVKVETNAELVQDNNGSSKGTDLAKLLVVQDRDVSLI